MPYVLYIDHKGHPAPITECFHATASRRLSSSVDRYPPSTVTALDSAYCAQCLTFYDAAAASNAQGFQCSSCQRCPTCLTALQIVKEGEKFLYNCSFCSYKSTDSVASTTSVEALQDLLKTKRKTRQFDPFQELHDEASQFWEERKLSNNRPAARASGEWSLELMETQLRRNKTKHVYAGKLPSIENLSLRRTTIEEIRQDDSVPNPTAHPILSAELQPLADPTQPLLPLPTPLTPRLSRRCRAELEEGRPGILLKPKLNVLEGDSSLATGQGQWHRKDSSAVGVIPRVRIVAAQQHDNSSIPHALLFRVTNPTLGDVRVQFSADAKDHRPQLFEDVLVDSITQTRLDTIHIPTPMAAPVVTEVVQLKSAEDSILELGGGATKQRVPLAVTNWSAPAVSETSRLRLVAQSSASAWLEWTGIDSTREGNAVLLTMRIHVGNGSWESSLIRPQGDDDTVDFDLILAFDKP